MNGYQAYRRVQVETASASDLLLLLYDGAIRFAKKARLHLQGGENEAAHNALVRTQAIVAELSAALDFDVRLAHSLFQLYTFITERLVEANVTKTTAPIDDVLPLLEELRDTWRQALGRTEAADASAAPDERLALAGASR